jgi:hypothetical protein
VEPRLEHLQQPAPHARRTAAPRVARPARTSSPARSRLRPDHHATRPKSPPVQAAPGSGSPPLRDRGISLLTIFTAATLLIVALVCIVGSVDRWWILIPVMAVDFAVTGAVLAVMVRLLDDGSKS